MKILVLVIALATVASCALPSQWAENLEGNVKCNMTVAEVEALAGKKILKESVPRADMTHYIRDDGTDVWFVFEGDKLKSVQILWAHKMMKYASYQRKNLCGE
jgi:hypothetical protein